MTAKLTVIDGGLSPRTDAVARLHRFQGDHPEVEFTSPTMGRYGQYIAVIPPRTIPSEDRELTLKCADLRGLMDQLDDVFSQPAAPD